jgi:hypothetical protein
MLVIRWTFPAIAMDGDSMSREAWIGAISVAFMMSRRNYGTMGEAAQGQAGGADERGG